MRQTRKQYLKFNILECYVLLCHGNRKSNNFIKDGRSNQKIFHYLENQKYVTETMISCLLLISAVTYMYHFIHFQFDKYL